jgi:hypothetical protein
MRRPSGVIAVAIERTQALQQFARGRHAPAGGASTKRSRHRPTRPAPAPGRPVRPGDLGAALRLQPLRLRPQAVRAALGDATGAAGALVGGGLRDVTTSRRAKPLLGRSAARARAASITTRTPGR